VATNPALGKMLRRGVLRRCPWCGDWHGFFRLWLRKKERCENCGIRWDRGTDGQELGAVVINLILTVGIVVIGMGVALFATYPEVYVFPMAAGAVVAVCVVSAIVYPIGYTIYHALDLRFRAPEPDELAEAIVALAALAEQRSGAQSDSAPAADA
jgi:uncharacterized protein (DUF983 family)